jgi:hypothetical protein
MKYSSKYIADLILRHFGDDLTAEENAILEKWLTESPYNRQILEELEEPEQPYEYSQGLVPD